MTPTAESGSSLVIAEHLIERGTRLVISGEIDASSVEEFTRALTTIVGRGRGDVELDMSGVTFVDSQGLRALVTAHQTGATLPSFAIVEMSPVVRRLLELTGLDLVFAIE